MNLHQTALARSNGYALLSDLFLNGVTAENWPTVQQTDLAVHLPEEPDFEQLAAQHYDLISHQIFPYESAFLSEDGMLGGEVANQVLHYFEQIRLPLETAVSEPDHIGWELYALSFLCGAEADAWEDGLQEVALRMQHQQQRFLESHLLRWSPAFLVGVLRQERPFYTAIGELLWGLLTTHYKHSESVLSSPLTLPEPPNVLADEKAGLRDIVAVLIRPCYAGWFISRRDITVLSRQFELPHGFGSKEQMLLNLLRSAVQYDAMPQLLNQLIDMAEQWEKAYEQLAEGEIGGFIRPWQNRLHQTKNFLSHILQKTKDTPADFSSLSKK
ncbi:MAG: molecular chaperone TorD family protein [Chloroflexota bacterium]